jgi:hypothetical protein
MNKALLIGIVAFTLSGCAPLISSATSGFTDNLSASIMDQDDPETAKAALPTFMVTIDSLIRNNPNEPDLLVSGATLNASYGAIFVDDDVRAARLTTRARRYASTAICESYAPLAYLRAHSSDWNSLAELPQIEALFNHYMDISGDEVNGAVYTYMGILLTLRPPALGGEPERAREYFEKAIAITDGRDLSAKVEFARGYARLLYERELHDRLLNEVMAADPAHDGFTLSNVLAKEQAAALLAEADDYF